MGPRAVAWGLEAMAHNIPPGADRRKMLEEADKAREDAAVMKKIQKGWSAYGMHPWCVVHEEKPEKQIARYNSCPGYLHKTKVV